MTFIRSGNFETGLFIERENRFVMYVKADEELLRCHLPNPGRMVFLLIEGETDVIFERAPVNSQRKTDGTVIGIKKAENVINLDTMMFSELLPYAIRTNQLDIFATWRIIAREKTIGKHRFDYILEIDSQEVICEVKSTTRVVETVACFPDAVSKRATSHVRSLQQLSQEGRNCMIIFTVYQEADTFAPCSNIDPDFAEAFYDIRGTIDVVVLQIKGRWIDNSAIEYSITKNLPVLLKS